MHLQSHKTANRIIVSETRKEIDSQFYQRMRQKDIKTFRPLAWHTVLIFLYLPHQKVSYIKRNHIPWKRSALK